MSWLLSFSSWPDLGAEASIYYYLRLLQGLVALLTWEPNITTG